MLASAVFRQDERNLDLRHFVSSRGKIARLQADASYCRDRVSLLRAKLYRWGLPPSARLRQLERELAHAEKRVQDERSRPDG
jgi:hypothetical protein